MTTQRFVLAFLLIAALLASGTALAGPGASQTRETAINAHLAGFAQQETGWASGFDPPGMNLPVHALASGPYGSLYAGGYFTAAGGVAANYIAGWDGAEWYPLASGMGGGRYDSSPVYALAVGPDGSLYAGGNFTIAGGVEANYIARWDGTQWHPLGIGMGGGQYGYSSVSALAIGPDGSLYAGGDFTTAGGVVANYIARWDAATSSWHPLGSGMDGRVDSMVVGSDGSLYAGGVFTIAGGVAVNHIARWDAASPSWHPLGGGMAEYGAVWALVVAPDGSLYAGGSFSIAGSTPANRVARWDGTQWHPLGSGVDGLSPPRVNTLVVAVDGSLYAGGTFTTAGGTTTHSIARWDGAQWHPLDSGMGGEEHSSVNAMAIGLDGSLYTGGDFSIAGGVPAYFISRWDTSASTWHPLPSGNGMGGSVSTLAMGPDRSLYAGGHFASAGGVLVNNIARWDSLSSTWHPLGDGITEGDYPSVNALAFGPDSVLYVGGWFHVAGGLAAKHIAFWNPQTMSWHALGSGVDTLYGYDPPEVRALAVATDGSLYAAGSFDTAGGIGANNIARWDQTTSSWHPLGSGTNGSISALAIGSDGSLYVGGFFRTAGAVQAHGIARWDGAAWHPLAGGVTGGWGTPCVKALAFGPDDLLYAGGIFTVAGGAPANNIALWDGTRWWPLGNGAAGIGYPAVFTLTSGRNGLLYVGGRFATVDNVTANNIAYWDQRDSSWHALARGLDDSVHSLAPDLYGSLYAGGRFTNASGVPSGYIAYWKVVHRRYLPLISKR